MNKSLEGGKVGDIVIISSHYHGESISRIAGITKSGNYKLEGDGKVYYPSGRERATGWHLSYAWLACPQEIKELRDKWEIKRLKNRIEAIVPELDIFKLRQIANILEQEIT